MVEKTRNEIVLSLGCKFIMFGHETVKFWSRYFEVLVAKTSYVNHENQILHFRRVSAYILEKNHIYVN